jgi:hypothetical protein
MGLIMLNAILAARNTSEFITLCSAQLDYRRPNFADAFYPGDYKAWAAAQLSH